MSVVLFSSSNLEGLQVQVTIAAIIDFGRHSYPALMKRWLALLPCTVQLGVRGALLSHDLATRAREKVNARLRLAYHSWREWGRGEALFFLASNSATHPQDASRIE
jgi:hypothetical protein